jgi:poly-gamma-glutamate capsule biosynthesis protein CapA/YwtB (metallophosphatase superfamily)
MYFPDIDPQSGELQSLTITPMHIARFRLHQPAQEDADWLRDRLDRECRALGTRVAFTKDGRLTLRWQ